jgi:cobalt/nickel transport system ATP-binding protein
MNAPALVMRDVTVRYEPGEEAAIASASFTVAAGERVALVGLNGSGKTTLLMAAAGLVPHEGEIHVCGIALSRRTLSQIRERIGLLFNVPEDQLLFPKVVDDAAFGLLRRGVPPREASASALKTLDELGVAHLAESPLHHLSHGQKQRVALAGTLVGEPGLLLLDEPSAGLDPPGRRRLASLLKGFEAAILLATHDIEFARRLCNRFIVLDGGRIVSDGADLEETLRRWETDGPADAALSKR